VQAIEAIEANQTSGRHIKSYRSVTGGLLMEDENEKAGLKLMDRQSLMQSSEAVSLCHYEVALEVLYVVG
jgi:hypothetical protein